MPVTPTLVNVDLRKPSDTGVDLPAKGYLECVPSMRRNVDTYVVLPQSFNETLVDGKATLMLAPTDGTVWYWKITERNNRGTTRRVSVPTPGPVNYGDLPDVFPLPPGDTTGASLVALNAEIARATAAEATKVNSSTYTAGLAAKQAIATRDHDVATDVGTLASETAVAVAAKIRAVGDPVYAPIGSSGSALTDVAAVVSADGALVVSKHNPVDATSGARAMTLAAASGAGKMVSLEKTDATTSTVTVTVANLRGSGGTLSLAYSRETILLASKADGSWWPVAGHRTKASLDAVFAPIASPAFTGNPTAPTPSPGDNDTSVATTAFTTAAIAAAGAGTNYTLLNAKYIDTLNGLIGATTVGFVTGQSTVQTSVTSAVSSGATVLPVASATGILPTMSLILNYGTASQQVVKVVSVASNNVTVSPALTAGVANAGKVSPLWNDQFHLTGWGYTGIAYYVVNAKNADGSDVFSLSSGQRITFFGNSWIAGKSQWADAVTAKFPTAVTTNAGVGGDTSADLLARFATDVPTDSKYVVFNEPGGNDIGLGTSKTTVVDNLQKLVRKIQAIGAIPVYTGTAPLAGFLTDSLTDATMVADLMRDGHMAAADGILGLVAKPLSSWFTVTGTGDVVGPSSAVDNAIARFDATTGKLIQTSPVTISDTGKVSGAIDGTAATDLATKAQADAAQAAAIAASAQRASNLSDLASAATARTNLGLGTAATTAASAYDVAGAATSAVAAGLTAVATLTNKRINPRVVNVTTSATVTLDWDATDLLNVTAQAGPLTIAFTGTPVDGQPITISLKDNGTARPITYPAAIRVIGVILPTSTVAGKITKFGGRWDAADAKLQVFALQQEA